MAEKNEIENGEEKRDDRLSKNLKDSHNTYEMLKELLDETTSKVIEDIGFERNEKVAGVYGDGTTYGTGVEEDEYNIIITGRPRKHNTSSDMSHGPTSGTLEKQIFLGAKRMESHIDFEIKGKILHLQYRSPEAGFFRGVEEYGDTFMVKEKLTVPLKNAKKEVKELFKDAAKREVGFLTNTKLGVEDRMDASTTSIVENLDMKKLSIKNLLDLDKETVNENEKFDSLPSDEEQNIEKVKKLNTQKVDNVKGDKYLLFDDEESSEEDLMEALRNLDKGEMSNVFKDELEKEFGTRNLETLTPAERKDTSRLRDVFHAIDKKVISKDEEVNEISTSGPAIAGSAGGFKDGAPSGAGGYNTKEFSVAKRGKNKKSNNNDEKSKAGSPYNVPVNHPFYESEGALNEGASKKPKMKKDFKDTPYSKKNSKRPKVDKDYNVIPEDTNTNASKPYTQVVKVDPDYHPQGMPFVKPNSKEEYERTVGRDHDKLKRMGLNESDSERHERLRKKRFNSIVENEQKGINKRYIVTEKTTEEYEKERWAKLSQFNKFETIKEAEELNSITENSDKYRKYYEDSQNKNKKIIKESENKEKKIIKESEKTVEVEKPGSVFGITQKFYEKDFINENKKFILDLNSMVFVPNPNLK